MGPTTSDTQPQGDHVATQEEPTGFPRLVLPPAPTFGQPAPVAPAGEAPAQPWQSPFPQPDPVEQYRAYTYQVVPPPLPVAAATAAPAPMPVPVPEPDAAAPVAHAAPRADAAPPALGKPAIVATAEAASGPTRAVIVLFAVASAFLAWASQMAFSAGLLALSALLVVQLAAGLAAGASPRARLVAGVALLVGMIAAWKGFHELGGEAFVAGLFVLIAVVPMLLALGIAQLLLRRRAKATGDLAVRDSGTIRFVALGLLLLAGFQAHRSFAAWPDAIVTILVCAHVCSVALRVVRGGTSTPATQ